MAISNPVKALEKAGALHLDGKYVEAERAYRRLNEEWPNDPEVMRLIGVCCAQQGRPQDGLSFAREAVIAAPKYAESQLCLAGNLEGCGLYDEALTLVDGVVELLNEEMLTGKRSDEEAKEKAATARFTRALCLLAKGDYLRGFREYEAGRYIGARQGPMGRDRTSPYEKWRGDRLDAKSHLVVVWEQGYGDTIAFSRFLPTVCERAACRVTFAVQEALVPLFERQKDRPYEVVRATKGDILPPHTHYANLLSLPYLLGTDHESVRTGVYVSADTLGHLSPNVTHIGVAWEGSPGHIDNTRRNMTKQLYEDVKAWSPKCAVHSLQFGDTEFPMNDFYETALAVNSMDLVVTTCTSIAHLAGALGKPTLLMLSKPGYWMWGLNDRLTEMSYISAMEFSSWYSSIQLCRQHERGNWEYAEQCLVDSLNARGLT